MSITNVTQRKGHALGELFFPSGPRKRSCRVTGLLVSAPTLWRVLLAFIKAAPLTIAFFNSLRHEEPGRGFVGGFRDLPFGNTMTTLNPAFRLSHPNHCPDLGLCLKQSPGPLGFSVSPPPEQEVRLWGLRGSEGSSLLPDYGALGGSPQYTPVCKGLMSLAGTASLA